MWPVRLAEKPPIAPPAGTKNTVRAATAEVGAGIMAFEPLKRQSRGRRPTCFYLLPMNVRIDIMSCKTLTVLDRVGGFERPP